MVKIIIKITFYPKKKYVYWYSWRDLKVVNIIMIKIFHFSSPNKNTFTRGSTRKSQIVTKFWSVPKGLVVLHPTVCLEKHKAFNTKPIINEIRNNVAHAWWCNKMWKYIKSKFLQNPAEKYLNLYQYLLVLVIEKLLLFKVLIFCKYYE